MAEYGVAQAPGDVAGEEHADEPGGVRSPLTTVLVDDRSGPAMRPVPPRVLTGRSSSRRLSDLPQLRVPVHAAAVGHELLC